jgi:dipeptidyl aminopeptidase/acylaminoacyl peptidase
LKEKEILLLRAFNVSNKNKGFFRKVVGATGDPELLSMGQYFTHIINWCQDPNISNIGMQPVKAKDVDIWIVQRQSVADAPNYYKTADFKSFKRLTNFQPQNGRNWVSEELHTFTHIDGQSGQGILYKPEDFDSTKKYPVLIIFYGGYSNNLHQFPVPSYNYNAITPGTSPIWFVNNGYLVFTPDIYISPIKVGAEAFNVIEGAAKYLKSLSYVEKNGLGCCSHSWSAKLGAYLLTHSPSFGAMAISEGYLYANMINVALSTDESGRSKLASVENVFQFGSFWENRESWLDQTTVLNVNKTNSPLLLLCNKESSKEYQDQTLQLFTALRRLEKKVWWLKYDKARHNLSDLNEQKDYTIRYTQFFDHLLKQAPAPMWMTQGIPASLRGIEERYMLDPSNSCGADCSVCKKWNEQYKKHPEMFKKPVSVWSLVSKSE